jgi:predicted RNase H-like HicB family nuclease
MKLKVIISPGDDGGFIAEVPALRGCCTQGRTRDETISNIREAIQAWLEVEQDKAESNGNAVKDVEVVAV